jgi:hypothetical protein
MLVLDMHVAVWQASCSLQTEEKLISSLLTEQLELVFNATGWDYYFNSWIPMKLQTRWCLKSCTTNVPWRWRRWGLKICEPSATAPSNAPTLEWFCHGVQNKACRRTKKTEPPTFPLRMKGRSKHPSSLAPSWWGPGLSQFSRALDSDKLEMYNTS